MPKSNGKFKNKLYGVLPSVDTNARCVAIAVLEENKKNVRGLKFLVNGNENFKLPIRDFETLLTSGRISHADDIPPEIVEELSKQWLTNAEKEE